MSFRHIPHASHAALVLLLLLGGCGGGSDAPHSQPPPPQVAAAARVAIAQAAFGLRSLYAPMAAPLLAAAPDLTRVGVSASACLAGGLSNLSTLAPGSALPGSAVPMGANFSACELFPGLVLDGQAQVAAVAAQGGSAWTLESTVTGMRQQSVGSKGRVEADLEASGQASLSHSRSSDALQLVERLEITPKPGLAVVDKLRQQPLTLDRGTLVDEVRLSAGPRPVLKRQMVEFRSLAVVAAGKPYVLNGSASVDPAPAGGTGAGSGEILLTDSYGRVAARILGTAAGFSLDVDGTRTPL